MNTDLTSDSVKLTLFFTEDEITGWDDVLGLNLLSVAGPDIDNEEIASHVVDNSDIVINDQRNGSDGYMTFTFWASTNYNSYSLTDRPSIPENETVMNSMDIGLLSLRDLVEQACPGDTINFDVSLMGDTIKLTSQELTLDRHLVIIGNGMEGSIISGEGNRAFFISGNHNVQMKGLAIVKSEAPINGGAIYNLGNLTLEDVLLKDNKENGLKKALTNDGVLTVKGVLHIK